MSLKVWCARKVKKEPLCQWTVPEWIKSSGLIKITWWLAFRLALSVKIWKKNFLSSVLYVAMNLTPLNSLLLEDGSVPGPQAWKRTSMVTLTTLLWVLKSPRQLVPSKENRNHQESAQALMCMNSFWDMKEISESSLKLPSSSDSFHKAEFMNRSFSMILKLEPSSCMMVTFKLKLSFSIKSLASQYQIGRQSTIYFWNVIKNRRKK